MNRKQMNSANLTIRLLRTVGSPFILDHELPENKDDALELYNYATKNKIGLAYLEALEEQGKFEEFGLEVKYQAEQKTHNEQLITASRISELFNSSGVNYAIFKSIMPFPATPNDVDIIHFGSDEEYKKVAEIMLRSNYIEYIEVKGLADAEQRMFHDARVCRHPNTPKKDIYDIDLYQKIAASHVIYLEKKRFEKYVMEMNIEGNNKIKVLRPEAELVAIIIHSIIPEMLCTLFVYYATLHHLERMNSEEINRFVYIAKENKVTFPVRTLCSLVGELHQVAHGFVPDKIEKVLAEVGDEKSERKILLKNNFLMPHRYSWSTILRTFFEKGKEKEFRKSSVKQTIYMLNPKLFRWVVTNVILRRKRETY